MAYQAPAPGQKENPGASTESVRSVTAVRRRAGSAKPKAHGCPSRQLPHQPQGQTCRGVLCSLPPPVADDNEGYGDGQCQPQGHSCCPPWNDGGMPWGERKGEGDIFDAGQSLETFLNTVSITDHRSQHKGKRPGQETSALVRSQERKLATFWRQCDSLHGFTGPGREMKGPERGLEAVWLACPLNPAFAELRTNHLANYPWALRLGWMPGWMHRLRALAGLILPHPHHCQLWFTATQHLPR